MMVFNSVDLPAPLRPSSVELAVADIERRALDDVALAVEGIDSVEDEQGRTRRGNRVGARHMCRFAAADVYAAHGLAVASCTGAAIKQYPALVHDRHPVGKREYAIDVVLDQ